jgi:hypothetical protein
MSATTDPLIAGPFRRDLHPLLLSSLAALAGFSMLLSIGFGLFAWLSWRASAPQPAPEAERVLEAQIGLPFQALIPAYLPAGFDRREMEIRAEQVEGEATDQAAYAAPTGAVLHLVYANRQGQTLTFSEWMPPAVVTTTKITSTAQTTDAGASALACPCGCGCTTGCAAGAGYGLPFNERIIAAMRVRVLLSAPEIVTYDQLALALDTLGPAANSQVFSRPEDVPLSLNLPPAQPAIIAADGAQELTLVVAPDGYSPVHFSVQKGQPARLIFRQLGQVGCGNELIVTWGAGQSATLLLASPSDQQTLEFTPEEAGEFRFQCPHDIYRGVMTVID